MRMDESASGERRRPKWRRMKAQVEKDERPKWRRMKAQVEKDEGPEADALPRILIFVEGPY